MLCWPHRLEGTTSPPSPLKVFGACVGEVHGHRIPTSTVCRTVDEVRHRWPPLRRCTRGHRGPGSLQGDLYSRAIGETWENEGKEQWQPQGTRTYTQRHSEGLSSGHLHDTHGQRQEEMDKESCLLGTPRAGATGTRRWGVRQRCSPSPGRKPKLRTCVILCVSQLYFFKNKNFCVT